MLDGDRALGDAVVLTEDVLDLLELDAEAADLDLLVDAAEELERAVSAIADQVAGAVGTARCVERMLDELLRRQLVPLPIATAQTFAAEQQFAGHAGRHVLVVLVDGARNIKLFGEEYVVKARIETLGGLSAHAGQSELVNWAGQFDTSARIYLVHGEPRAQDALADRLWREHGIKVDIPSQGQSVIL